MLGWHPEPGREVPPGSEGMRIADLHNRKRGADRPDRGDLCQSATELVAPMPSHQPGFDLAKFRLEPDILVAQRGEQVLGERREVLVARNAYQHPARLFRPPWCPPPQPLPPNPGSHA